MSTQDGSMLKTLPIAVASVLALAVRANAFPAAK
jgi:hypothetical protein